MCMGLNDAVICDKFSLRMHPTLKAWMTHQVAIVGPDVKVVLGRGSSYGHIRTVFIIVICIHFLMSLAKPTWVPCSKISRTD